MGIYLAWGVVSVVLIWFDRLFNIRDSFFGKVLLIVVLFLFLVASVLVLLKKLNIIQYRNIVSVKDMVEYATTELESLKREIEIDTNRYSTDELQELHKQKRELESFIAYTKKFFERDDTRSRYEKF